MFLSSTFACCSCAYTHAPCVSRVPRSQRVSRFPRVPRVLCVPHSLRVSRLPRVPRATCVPYYSHASWVSRASHTLRVHFLSGTSEFPFRDYHLGYHATQFHMEVDTTQGPSPSGASGPQLLHQQQLLELGQLGPHGNPGAAPDRILSEVAAQFLTQQNQQAQTPDTLAHIMDRMHQNASSTHQLQLKPFRR